VTADSPATGALAGRVAVVTGAGRGIGREHALLFAREGAQVVVNDTGAALEGSSPGEGAAGAGAAAAEAVVDEIRAAGGEAVANADDVSDWDGGRRLVETALDAFGDLHVLVNNAGNLRDRYLTEMTLEEWDDVLRVHLRGHFVATRWAARHWKAQSEAGRPVKAAVVNTTSTSGLFPNTGQSNYGAAKAGIAALTVIEAAELGQFGVRVNAVAPLARSRMTESNPWLAGIVAPPPPNEFGPDPFDAWHPANVSPLVAWLCTEACPVTGEVLLVQGGMVQRFRPWTLDDDVKVVQDERWTVEALGAALDGRFPARGWPTPG
jgi:NAD(P)-dependent dehydrogenase (short-subunit alcohol dehydrogenase family)